MRVWSTREIILSLKYGVGMVAFADFGASSTSRANYNDFCWILDSAVHCLLSLEHNRRFRYLQWCCNATLSSVERTRQYSMEVQLMGGKDWLKHSRFSYGSKN